MKKFCCEKCGSKEVYIKKVNSSTGLYCSDCGKWIKWLPKNEIDLAERYIEEYNKQHKNSVDVNINADVETFLNSLKLYSKLLKISKKELIELIKNEL